MLRDVIHAAYRHGYQVELTFEDGSSGVVDLQGYRDRGGVFARFRDLEYFRNFSVNPDLGTLCWPDGVDIAPETLHALATGSELPAWMPQEHPERASTS